MCLCDRDMERPNSCIVFNEIFHTGFCAQNLGRVYYWGEPLEPFQIDLIILNNIKYLYVLNCLLFMETSHLSKENWLETATF